MEVVQNSIGNGLKVRPRPAGAGTLAVPHTSCGGPGQTKMSPSEPPFPHCKREP